MTFLERVNATRNKLKYIEEKGVEYIGDNVAIVGEKYLFSKGGKVMRVKKSKITGKYEIIGSVGFKSSCPYPWMQLYFGRADNIDISVHHVMAKVFGLWDDKDPLTDVINHKDNDSRNCVLNNLEACSISENSYHWTVIKDMISKDMWVQGSVYDNPGMRASAKGIVNKLRSKGLARVEKEVLVYNRDTFGIIPDIIKGKSDKQIDELLGITTYLPDGVSIAESAIGGL